MPIEETNVLPFSTVQKHIECQENQEEPCEFVYPTNLLGIFPVAVVCGYASAHVMDCRDPEKEGHTHRLCCYHKEFVDAQDGAIHN